VTDPGAPTRRLSAATAAKIREHQSMSPEERRLKSRLQRQGARSRPVHGVSASLTRETEIALLRQQELARLHGNSSVRQLREAAAGSVQRVEQVYAQTTQRLSNENWRLFRKYERLENELHELRASDARHQEELAWEAEQHQKQLQNDVAFKRFHVSDKDRQNTSLTGSGSGGLLPAAKKNKKTASTAATATGGASIPVAGGNVRSSGPSGGSNGNANPTTNESSSKRDKVTESPARKRKQSESDISVDEVDGSNRHNSNSNSNNPLPPRSRSSHGADPELWEDNMKAALDRLKEENRKLLERVSVFSCVVYIN
jgi:hypothetical protein